MRIMQRATEKEKTRALVIAYVFLWHALWLSIPVLLTLWVRSVQGGRSHRYVVIVWGYGQVNNGRELVGIRQHLLRDACA